MRRCDFLKRTGLTLGGTTAAWALAGCAGKIVQLERAPEGHGDANPAVCLISDPADTIAAAPPAQWALTQLAALLRARGLSVRHCRSVDEAGPEDLCILAAGRTSAQRNPRVTRITRDIPDTPEALVITPAIVGGRAVLLACGSDARGLTYALLELADRVENAADGRAALVINEPVIERPANKIRSVVRLLVSEVEDKGWYHDHPFWERYLSMLAAQRFNRFHLAFGLGYDFPRGLRDTYFYFAYPFLVEVPGYSVRVTQLADNERQRNLDTLRFISDQAALRGLHFQLGLWTHAYQWTDSPQVNYTITGLTPETHAPYCHEALRTVLRACPSIAGVTLRIHGESGVAEGSYPFWKSVFKGVAEVGRTVELDLHAKGIDQTMIDNALATGVPVTISPKYWAEHMGLPYHQAAIRELEMPPSVGGPDKGFFAQSTGSRSFTRYGYGDLLAEDRRYGVLHRMWPGTQRLLLWGDPAMAAAYGRASSFCGSLGMELSEPLSFKGRKGSGKSGGRDAYADASLKPADGDWEKYLYSYRLWGRMLYNPDAKPETWQRLLRRQHGPAAAPIEAALAHSSRILPLITTAHGVSAANNFYWPEMYFNQSIVDAAAANPYDDAPKPRRFGTVTAFDPEIFCGIDEYVDHLLSGELEARYTPVEVARWLLALAQTARLQLAEAEKMVPDRNSAEFRRLAIDTAITSGIGEFFAHKIRAALYYALYARSGHCPALAEALTNYQAARAAWAALAQKAQGVYVADVTFGYDSHLRGHWIDRLAAIDRDIERMARLEQAPAEAATRPAPAVDADIVEQAMGAAIAVPAKALLNLRHAPPQSFDRSQNVAIEVAAGDDSTGSRIVALTLRYRRVNQAEHYVAVPMQRRADQWSAVIPGAYTDSPFALQYHFVLRDYHGVTWLYPGLPADLCGQPYFVIRQA